MKTVMQQEATYGLEDHEAIAQITKIVLKIGQCLAQPKVVEKFFTAGFRSFSDYPALCIFFGELAAHFPEGEWDQIAHQYMLKLQGVINQEPLDGLGLFGGAPGLGMAGLALANGGTRYSNFIISMNEFIKTSCEERLPWLQQRLGGNVGMGDYDGISGMAGVTRYLLLFKDQPTERRLLRENLQYLVSLTADCKVDGQEVPGWYISVAEQFLPGDQEKYPRGNFNVGMAHGISGVLAVLSVALLHKIQVPGQKLAIKKITNWLRQFQSPVLGRGGSYWPSHISWEEQLAGHVSNQNYDRDGWCYGTPGVARAMYLAGCALQDSGLQELGVQAFAAVFAKSPGEWGLRAPTFCHGAAGLLHLTQLMFLDTGLSRYKVYRQQVLASLLEKYESHCPFGFRELEWQNNELQTVNRVGLINGAVGCALTLLGLLKPIRSNWDVMFLVK